MRARSINLKLNRKKLRSRLHEVPYMGQLLTSEGLKPDPSKISAIVEMPRPTDKKSVQRLLGCVNYLSKFMPRLADVCEPMRRIIEKNSMFMWQSQQEEAFQTVKTLLTQTPVLRYYDVTDEVSIQCDASETGLGATLLQQGQPVAFASRALTQTERRYAQIEKECLAIVFGCVRFDQYLHGRDLISVQSDHKPLVPIFQKSLHQAPKRLQRMLLRLQKYNLKVNYLSGSKMYIADMLSRAYLPETGIDSDKTSPEYQVFQVQQESRLFSEIADINQVDYMRLSDATHSQIKVCTNNDPTLQTLMTTVMTGWPDLKDEVPLCIREYWNFRDELTAQDGVLYKGMKVIVPLSMRPQMIARSHKSHLGADACIRRARDVLFWPGMSADIQNKVQTCGICADFLAKQQKEPLMTHKIPTTPWSKVGQDLFSLNGENYLVTVDYYSDYFELDLLNDTTANSVIEATKSHFARHGIADMVTDNGPQYTSEEFSRFARDWEFKHTTSSPYHSQSNGKSESAVKIAKKLIKKTKQDNDKDMKMALLEWRNTPDTFGSSPVQKLMSRRTRTTMPTADGLLKPQVIDGVADNIHLKRQKAKASYDRHSKPLPELEIGDNVRLQPVNPRVTWQRGACVAKIGPRSYLVESEDGQLFRRNRKFIRNDFSQPTQPEPNNADTEAMKKPESVPTMPVGRNSTPSKKSQILVPETHPPSAGQHKVKEKTSSRRSLSRDAEPQSQNITKSGRRTVPPARFKDFEM